MKKLLLKIRYWLIKRLTGKRVVILNATIEGGIVTARYPGNGCYVTACLLIRTDTSALQAGEG